MTRGTDNSSTALVNGFIELNELAARGGPRTIVSGKGVFVRDTDDNELLDAVSGMWAAGLGFGDPELVDAAVQQLSTMPAYHASADKATPSIIELCERLREVGPGDVRRVLLTNSGSDANDTQLKLLTYLWHERGEPGRRTVFVHERGYHGSTLGSGSLSDMGASGAAFGLNAVDVRTIAAPCKYWNGLAGETEAAYSTRLAEQFERALVEAGPETIAGVFLEPVLGAGGIVVPPTGYLTAVAEIARRYGVRVVADEVITGFGRTGSMWGSESLDLVPDSTSCAKALTGGYMPAGAVLVDEEMNDALMSQSARFGIFAHGFTTGGHPVSAAVGVRVLEILAERDIPGHVRAMSPMLERRLRALAEQPLVADVRGIGLLWGVELRGPDAEELVRQVVDAAAAHGLVVRGIGEVLCLCPPMIITEDEIDILANRLGAALNDVTARHRGDLPVGTR